MRTPYYNGCGGKDSISFSKLIRHNIPLLPQYDQEHAYKLWVGIEIEACKPHDIDFYRGGLLFAYFYANIKFTYRFCRKFWWTKLYYQLLLIPVILIGMNIFGIKYFNWCFPWNKREIPEIID